LIIQFEYADTLNCIGRPRLHPKALQKLTRQGQIQSVAIPPAQRLAGVKSES